jgi:AcrR family transcriptional regulator
MVIKADDVMIEMTTKEKIRQAAIVLFAEKGYHGTATSEIARLAGVAEGTVFKYFPKKKDLLKQVAIEMVEVFGNHNAIQGLEKILIDFQEASAEEFLTAIVHDRMQLLKDNKTIIKTCLIEMQYHKEIGEVFLEIFHKSILLTGSRIVESIRAKIDVGEIDDTDLIRELFGMILGILIHTNLFTMDNENPDRIIKSSIRIFIQGIRRGQHGED